MTRVCQLALGLTMALLLATAATGQDKKRRGGRGAGGFGGGQLMLLGQKSVQEELQLTEQQIEKITELSKKNREGFRDLKDLSEEDRRKKLAESNAASTKALAEVLKKNQSKRLKEISLQTRAGSALADPEIASALKLSEEQKEKVKLIREESRGKGRGGFSPEARKAAQEKLMGVLTDDQKSAWKTMTGEPFRGEIQPLGRGKGRPKNATPRKKEILEDVSFFEQDEQQGERPAAREKGTGKGPKGFGKGPWAGKGGKGPNGFGKGRDSRGGAWAGAKGKGQRGGSFGWSAKNGKHSAFGHRHQRGQRAWLGRHAGHRHGWASRSGRGMRGMASRFGHRPHRHGWDSRHHHHGNRFGSRGYRSYDRRGAGYAPSRVSPGWGSYSKSRPGSSRIGRTPGHSPGQSRFGNRGPISSRDLRADLERLERTLADLQRKLRR